MNPPENVPNSAKLTKLKGQKASTTDSKLTGIEGDLYKT